MAYMTYEGSIQSGSPVELYEFIQGAQRWTYTSGPDPILRLGQTHVPSPLKRDRIKQSTDVFKNGQRLIFPRDDEFASQFLGFAPEEVTTVTILRGHNGDVDAEFVVYWKGRVLAAKASDSQIDLECEPIFTSIRRPGLRAKFEYSCRHVLYGRGCGVNREAYKHEDLVLSMTGGLTLEVAGVEGIYPEGWFTGGIVLTQDGASRFIVAHANGRVTLARPMASLTTGQVVKLYPGCDHLKTTCNDKFNNIDNMGGFPWIPSRNPFDGSSVV